MTDELRLCGEQLAKWTARCKVCGQAVEPARLLGGGTGIVHVHPANHQAI